MSVLYHSTLEQAGAEMRQAQLQLMELGFTLINACCITLMIIDFYPEPNMPVNLVTSTYLHTSLLTCILACLYSFLYAPKLSSTNIQFQITH